eukprot:10271792-Alexandrium_andersonii.AAC.1
MAPPAHAGGTAWGTSWGRQPARREQGCPGGAAAPRGRAEHRSRPHLKWAEATEVRGSRLSL